MELLCGEGVRIIFLTSDDAKRVLERPMRIEGDYCTIMTSPFFDKFLERKLFNHILFYKSADFEQ